MKMGNLLLIYIMLTWDPFFLNLILHPYRIQSIELACTPALGIRRQYEINESAG